MKGIILYAKACRKYLTDRDDILFGMIQKEFNFKSSYGVTEIPKDTDIVITVQQRLYSENENNAMMYLTKLNKGIKLIGYLSDLDTLDYIPGRDIKMFDRYDLILSRYDYRFKKKYPQYVYKTIYLPNFFAPHNRYANLKFNISPINKILITGRLFEPTRYPLRCYIAKNSNPSKVDIMPHPKGHVSKKKLKNKKFYIGDRYAKRLNDYFACVTCCGLGCLLTKYLEIPAAGSLLIANETPDSKIAGFVPNEHFVPITKKNALRVMYKCLENPKKYNDIRKNGMKFVRENHSVKNRFEQLKQIIMELLNG